MMVEMSSVVFWAMEPSVVTRLYIFKWLENAFGWYLSTNIDLQPWPYTHQLSALYSSPKKKKKERKKE